MKAAQGITLWAAVAALSSCSLVPQSRVHNWYNPNVTAEQFAADKSQCVYEVKMRGRMSGNEFTDLFQLCMQGKGYVLSE